MSVQESKQQNISSRIRLNKLIADSGLASRRAADRMIEEGLVSVNGKKVYELGIKVDPRADRVMVSGKPLKAKFEHIYIMFHKPTGVLTTMEDPLDRTTIKEFLEEVPSRVFPVGRLDWDSEGLLLLTNDGDYANRVASPQAEVTKTYLVKVDGQPRDDQLVKLLKGGFHCRRQSQCEICGKSQTRWRPIRLDQNRNHRRAKSSDPSDV